MRFVKSLNHLVLEAIVSLASRASSKVVERSDASFCQLSLLAIAGVLLRGGDTVEDICHRSRVVRVTLRTAFGLLMLFWLFCLGADILYLVVTGDPRALALFGVVVTLGLSTVVAPIIIGWTLYHLGGWFCPIKPAALQRILEERRG